MKRMLCFVLAAVLLLGLCACGGKAGGTNLTFTTGGETGTYYAYGSVLSQYVSNNTDLTITAVSSNGPHANTEDMDAGSYQLGFCQSDVMSYAYTGTNLFAETGAVDCFSVVAALYMEQVQIVTLDPTIKSVADLKGKTPEEAMEQVGAVVEGYYAAESVKQLAERKGVELPICRCAYEVLYQGKRIQDVTLELMTRSKKDEYSDPDWSYPGE